MNVLYWHLKQLKNFSRYRSQGGRMSCFIYSLGLLIDLHVLKHCLKFYHTFFQLNSGNNESLFLKCSRIFFSLYRDNSNIPLAYGEGIVSPSSLHATCVQLLD